MSQIRGDGPREIRIQTDANAATFEAIGVNAHHVGDGWVVSLPADQSVRELIEALVEQDVAIQRVHETGASLEDLYGQLTEDTEEITA